MPRVRQVLRERGQLEEAPGLPPRDDEPAGLLPEDVALQCLHSRLHSRERSVVLFSFIVYGYGGMSDRIWTFCGEILKRIRVLSRGELTREDSF